MLMMSLLPGLSGLVLLRRLWLTLIGSRALFLGVVVLCFGLYDLVGIRLGRVGTTFLMLLMVLVFSCIVTLLLPHCLTCDVDLRRL